MYYLPAIALMLFLCGFGLGLLIPFCTKRSETAKWRNRVKAVRSLCLEEAAKADEKYEKSRQTTDMVQYLTYQRVASLLCLEMPVPLHPCPDPPANLRREEENL